MNLAENVFDGRHDGAERTGRRKHWQVLNGNSARKLL
jgi:hypothetical protein